jgi:hypothetical protein
MALSIPIISEFDGKGIDKAKKEFAQLETVGQKAQFAIRKAAIPAAIAVGALAAAGKSALAAGEEVNSANARIGQIAKSMDIFGESTDFVQKRLVKLAEAQAVELGISNLTIKATKAKLLTFRNLAKSANVVGGAFDRANMAALDMAAAGFGSAEGNAVQLGKALENPIKGIAALAKSGVTFTEQEKEKIRTLVESNKLLDAQDMILKAIEQQVGGTAAATADDSAKMKEGFAQVSQALGMSLLPILETVTPILLGFAAWAKENPGTFKVVAAAIGGIALSIMAINAAMALNPLGLIVIGIGALIAGVVLAYKRFESFRTIVNAVFSGIKVGVDGSVTAVKGLIAAFKSVFNGIASIWNNTLGKIQIKIPDIKGLPGRGQTFGIPKIPMLAKGGIVKASPGGTLALIGEGGQDEAVIPLDRMGSMGGNNITINVQGGDPNAVVDALRRYMQLNGSVPIRVSST